MENINSYISQRLATLGNGGDLQEEMKSLRAENAKLKEQLGQLPPANFKSEAQSAFEQSPEFEQILNVFFMRFIRDKFGSDFRDSPHNQNFQTAANQAFAEFEKNINKPKEKEGTQSGQTGKKDNKVSGRTNADENA